jgi:hypothetical protein
MLKVSSTTKRPATSDGAQLAWLAQTDCDFSKFVEHDTADVEQQNVGEPE